MKKAKKMKKTAKGFTLVECLIALCIFAIGSSVLVASSTQINQTLKTAMDTQRKLCLQAPRAQAKITDEAIVESVNKGQTDSTVREVSSLGFVFTPLDENGIPDAASAVEAWVYADTYNAKSASDKYQAGASLNYMVFDLNRVAGAGGSNVRPIAPTPPAAP